MNYQQFKKNFDCELLSYTKYCPHTGEILHRYDVLVTEKKSKIGDRYYSNIYSWGGAEPNKGTFNSVSRINDNVNRFIALHKVKKSVTALSV
jgi:hypothetical protein